jgi:CRP/FNR family transcriptional regulator
MNHETSEMERILEKLFPVWDDLDASDRSRLAAETKTRRFKAGSRVHRGSNDCIGALLVARGTLRVYFLSDEGREITLFHTPAGGICLLSASCVIPLITFEVFIDAQTDVDALLIPSPYLNALMEKNPRVDAFVYRQIAERFSDVMWVMQQVLFVSFDKRLATYLLKAAALHGGATIATTHDAIARDMGSAREVVSRMLKYFEREGWVRLERGSITLIDPKQLNELRE